MRVREQRERRPRRRDEDPPDRGGREAPRATELREELDELLDEVDGLLEENAEEFVKGYVQKGGE
jgi:ubiquitin-like protein Pup